jgi:hypothetical protein
MTDSYHQNRVYLPRQVSQAEIDRANDLLAANDLGRPLGAPAGTDTLTVVRVAGPDPVRVREALRTAGADAADVETDRVYLGGTFLAAGRDWGHGLLFIDLDAKHSEGLELPEWTEPPAGRRRPVIALLDSGVLPHALLPKPTAPDPFLLEPLWEPTLAPLPEPVRAKGDSVPMAYAHATFIAGLIRMDAPTARVLSMHVMQTDGRVSEPTVLEALDFLIEYREHAPLDVVCMAFGRILEAYEEPPLAMKHRLAALARYGVRFAAAAGNGGGQARVYPAAFATDIPEMDSVGSGLSAADRDYFSGHGDWVRSWRSGTAASIVPAHPGADDQQRADQLAGEDLVGPEADRGTMDEGWGDWRGTSFAVARRAAELANQAVA